MRRFLYVFLSLDHAKTTGPIELKNSTTLPDIPRTNIGLLLFRFAPHFLRKQPFFMTPFPQNLRSCILRLCGAPKEYLNELVIIHGPQ